MTVEEIIEKLELGEDVTLESGKTYDFTDKHSISIKGILYGNGATIVSKKFFPSGQMKFLFHLYQNGRIVNVNIQGPNPNIGPGLSSTDYWGAVNVINSGIIEKCTFDSCDKWAIRCTSHPNLVDKVHIEECVFNNIKRLGYGYGIWNQYADVNIINCKFFNCRHGVDGSSKVFRTYIYNCEFDRGNYIHVNMHAYSDNTHGGDIVSIKNSRFYGIAQPLELKLPYTSTGYVEVKDCLFEAPDDKLGKIAETGDIATFKSALYSFEKSTGSLPDAPKITGPEYTTVNVPNTYSASGYTNYKWSNNTNKNKTTRTVNIPQVYVLDCFGFNNSQTRSKRAYKTIVTDDPSKDGLFSFFAKGWGCTIDVFKDDKLISSIPSKKILNWSNFIFYGAGRYKIVISGEGQVYIDDWYEKSFYTTFENLLDVKLKYILDNGSPIGAGIVYGESRSGEKSLRLRLPTALSKIEIEKK